MMGNKVVITMNYTVYPLNIVTWANGTDEEIVAMVEAADQGLINLSDYWAVGWLRSAVSKEVKYVRRNYERI